MGRSAALPRNGHGDDHLSDCGIDHQAVRALNAVVGFSPAFANQAQLLGRDPEAVAVELFVLVKYAGKFKACARYRGIAISAVVSVKDDADPWVRIGIDIRRDEDRRAIGAVDRADGVEIVGVAEPRPYKAVGPSWQIALGAHNHRLCRRP